MEFLYSCISRNNVILAQYAFSSGDFDIIVSQILSKAHFKDHRIRMDKEDYHFFILHNDNGINVIICSTTSANSDITFRTLEQIYSAFLSKFSDKYVDAKQYQFDSEFNKDIQQIIANNMQTEKIKSIQQNLEIAKDSMMDSLEQTLIRDEKLNDLSNKASILDDSAQHFRREANSLRIKMLFERYKWLIFGIIIGIIIVIIFSILIFRVFNNKEGQK